MFSKVLIANRGEIAVRVIRALREMNVASVAVYSEADRSALHVQMADQAVCVGPAASSDSYLRGDRLLEAAKSTGSQAIHPGYGFLSENAAFARLCEGNNVKFIGPASHVIEKMGSKTAARELAQSVGAPLVPGSTGSLTNAKEAREIADTIGYPVLLKAAGGGGGKGMRRVNAEGELASALREASSEAERAFGSSEVYLEKLVERPRHIEVQVLGDEHGHLIHLGERECSIQRRHQKIIEECPSPLVLARPELRERLCQSALQIARAASYTNAGTLEFLVDQSGNFFFLEMNTRLQVEHPVTEWVTGVDLVHWQIRIAVGETLTLRQEDIAWHGSAIECRIYAEDPANNFFPSPGRISQYVEASGPGVRMDSGVFAGWNVPVDYDPLLAKLSVWAASRPLAIARLRRAVEETRVLGVTTNLSFFERLMKDEKWKAGDLDTGFIERFMPLARLSGDSGEDALVAAILAATRYYSQASTGKANSSRPARSSAWRGAGMRDLVR